MTELVITDVVEEIQEWQNQYGDFMYSVVAFAGQELVKANKKDRDRAVELQGLLKEAIGVPREFKLEPAGTSKNGYAKWKFLGFGTSQNGQNGSSGHGAPLLDRRGTALIAASKLPLVETEVDDLVNKVLYAATHFEAWLSQSFSSNGQSVSGTDRGGGEGLNGQT